MPATVRREKTEIVERAEATFTLHGQSYTLTGERTVWCLTREWNKQTETKETWVESPIAVTGGVQ